MRFDTELGFQVPKYLGLGPKTLRKIPEAQKKVFFVLFWMLLANLASLQLEGAVHGTR